MIELSTQRDCRYAYRELLQGYTYIEEKDLYIKHLRETDLGFIDGLNKKCIEECEKEGLLDIQGKIAFSKKHDIWDEALYQKKIFLEEKIKKSYEHARTLGKKSSIQFIESEIKPAEEEFKKTSEELEAILEPVSDTLCTKRVNEKYVYYSLFKDKECKTPFYTQEQFDNLSFLEMNQLVKEYNYHSSKFTELNINKISVCNFFLSAFFMSEDDPVRFYGRNILELSMYQLNLFSRGKFNKTVLSNGKEPPDHLYGEEEENGLYKLVNWYNTAYGMLEAERKSQSSHKRLYNH